jgi:dolichyl-phosphate beta-glucosyltransferase
MSDINPYLSIIIPCYNEGKGIVRNLHLIEDYLTANRITYEILVVVDGSTDNTLQIVTGYKDKTPNLQIIENSNNRGKGYSVRRGLMKARGELCLFVDADGSTSINHLDRFLPEFDRGCDVVIGTRRIKGAQILVHQPLYREITGCLGNWLIRTVLGLWSYRDTQCGFKMLTAKAAQTVAGQMVIDRFGFDFELITLAQKAGFHIKQLPVTWVNDRASSVRFLGPNGLPQVLIDLFKIKWRLLTGQYSLVNQVLKSSFPHASQ